MIQPQLAKKIIHEVRKLLDEDIIVMNTDGMIIASTNPNRLGVFHEGAVKVSKTGEKLIITKEDENQWSGVKAGINLPIMFQGEVEGVIGITGSPDKVSGYGELLKKMTELFIQESYYQEEIEWQARSLEAFVFDWMEKREWSDSFLNKAKLLGIDLTAHRQAVLIHYPPASLISFKPVWRNFSQSIRGTSNTIVIRWGNDRLLVLLDHELNDLTFLVEKWKLMLEKQLGASVAIGIGSSLPSNQLKLAFLQAERALKVALATSSIVHDDQLTLEMIVEDIRTETKQQFLERTIAPIQGEPELLATLYALFTHNFSYKQAADSIPIHINTLHYRLKKIEEATGLNPKLLKDQLSLYLAWMLNKQ
ncbi:carbohydrate diacid regulator [Bacillus ectoiniformans]|uniref:sugar diacid recognition domain-containing protein n=1 Tax=Bacillus ectoiniformans TaxID=1494429 RepID=UPI00195615A3|nr:carbohydrate diacid regulator [Bacillus ectoiniformans]